jgi:hypothetical protein
MDSAVVRVEIEHSAGDSESPAEDVSVRLLRHQKSYKNLFRLVSGILQKHGLY